MNFSLTQIWYTFFFIYAKQVQFRYPALPNIDLFSVKKIEVEEYSVQGSEKWLWILCWEILFKRPSQEPIRWKERAYQSSWIHVERKKGFPLIRAILPNIWNFYQEKNHLWGKLFCLCFSSELNVFDDFVSTFIQCPYINKDGLRCMPIELLLYLFLICPVFQEIVFFGKTSWLH